MEKHLIRSWCCFSCYASSHQWGKGALLPPRQGFKAQRGVGTLQGHMAVPSRAGTIQTPGLGCLLLSCSPQPCCSEPQPPHPLSLQEELAVWIPSHLTPGQVSRRTNKTSLWPPLLFGQSPEFPGTKELKPLSLCHLHLSVRRGILHWPWTVPVSLRMKALPRLLPVSCRSVSEKRLLGLGQFALC